MSLGCEEGRKHHRSSSVRRSSWFVVVVKLQLKLTHIKDLTNLGSAYGFWLLLEDNNMP